MQATLVSGDVRALDEAVRSARLLPASLTLFQPAQSRLGSARYAATENLAEVRTRCSYYGSLDEPRQLQLDTPLLRQADVRFAAVQQEAVADLTAARARSSVPAGSSRVGELTTPEREALGALQTAAEWAFDVHLEVDESIRALLRSEGLRG